MSDENKKTTPGAKKKTSGSRKKRNPKEKPKEKPSGTNAFPVVCLGASAGGLKSLEAFLSNVPQNCGMAFVVISHTDPDRTSLLPDILGRKSTIPVKAIEEVMVPDQNAVYLPPSNKALVMDQGRFHFKERSREADSTCPSIASWNLFPKRAGSFPAVLFCPEPARTAPMGFDWSDCSR